MTENFRTYYVYIADFQFERFLAAAWSKLRQFWRCNYLHTNSQNHFTSAITQFNLFKRWSLKNYLHLSIAYLNGGDRF
ncbi:MAG TPA: hypothetical protein V6D25_08335 [Leptolyngbyaceae cyanobacterium]